MKLFTGTNRLKSNFSLLLAVFISLVGLIVATILALKPQDIRQRAATETGVATITLTPDSASLTAGQRATIDFYVNTQNGLVDGVQVIANVEGDVPGDISLAPDSVAGLTLISSNLISSGAGKRFELAYLTTDFVPFTSNSQEVKIASLSFTAPSSGSMSVNFDKELSRIPENRTTVDVLATPIDSVYQFRAGSVNTGASLVGTSWNLLTINDLSLINLTSGGISFDEERVSGGGGCNNFFGTYQTGGDGSISFSGLVSTRRACRTPEGLSQQENSFLRGLESAVAYEIEGNILTVVSNDSRFGVEKLTFTRDGNTASPAPTSIPTPTPVSSPAPTSAATPVAVPAPTPTPPTPVVSSNTPPISTDTNLRLSEVRLIDATANSSIQTVSSSATVYLSEYPDFSIEAVRSNSDVGSVAFVVDGSEVQVENYRPYAIAGDTIGNFNPWRVSPGTYDIYMIPYGNRNKGGGVGVAKRLILTVMDGQVPQATPNSSPNRTTAPTPTATQQPAGTQTLSPLADTHGESRRPNNNYKNDRTIEVDGRPHKVAYLKFDLSSLSGRSVSGAKLRLKVTNGSRGSQTVHFVSDNSWAENTLTYNNRPSLGRVVATTSNNSSRRWVEIDVTSAVNGSVGGTLSLGIDSTHRDGLNFNSRESGNSPELVIDSLPLR